MKRFVVTAQGNVLQQWIVVCESEKEAEELFEEKEIGKPSVSETSDMEITDVKEIAMLDGGE